MRQVGVSYTYNFGNASRRAHAEGKAAPMTSNKGGYRER